MERIHYFHILADDYERHTFCTLDLTINSSQETYMEKTISIKGRQPNVDMNATHLFYTFKFQKYGVAKVNILFPIDLETNNTSNSFRMEKTPSI